MDHLRKTGILGNLETVKPVSLRIFYGTVMKEFKEGTDLSGELCSHHICPGCCRDLLVF